MDKNDDNELCDIVSNKCVKFSDGYRTLDVTVLDDNVMVTNVNKYAMGNQKDVVKIRKMDKDLNTLEEVNLDIMPNYFTYTSPDEKLYLFMSNGAIVSIDGKLNVIEYPIKSPTFINNATNISYSNNVSLDKNIYLLILKLMKLIKKVYILLKFPSKKGYPKLILFKQKWVNQY